MAALFFLSGLCGSKDFPPSVVSPEDCRVEPRVGKGCSLASLSSPCFDDELPSLYACASFARLAGYLEMVGNGWNCAFGMRSSNETRAHLWATIYVQ